MAKKIIAPDHGQAPKIVVEFTEGSMDSATRFGPGIAQQTIGQLRDRQAIGRPGQVLKDKQFEITQALEHLLASPSS